MSDNSNLLKEEVAKLIKEHGEISKKAILGRNGNPEEVEAQIDFLCSFCINILIHQIK